MVSYRQLKHSYTKLKERKWSNWWKLPRLALYLYGVVSYFWYFWCVAGLVIGVLYFIFFQDRGWKRNGIVLAFAIGFVNLLVFFYKAYSPLNLVIWSGLGIFLSFLGLLCVNTLLKRKTQIIANGKIFFDNHVRKMPHKVGIGFKFGVVLVPIISWSAVNLDFGVMFDNNPRLLWINAPSKVNTSEPFRVTVEAWDAFERLSAVYTGRVGFSIHSYNLSTYALIPNPQAILPYPYSFTGQLFGSDIAYEIKDGKDNGLHVFTVQIDTPGIHYILVTDSWTGNTYYSNPIMVDNYDSTDPLIYWGDIHSHSELSDGTGSADHSYFYARYIACLNFNALTDHGEILMFSPFSMDILETSTNNAYEAGEFVTFHGIEWTNVRTGHYIVIFSGDTLLKDPVLSYITLPTTDDLWAALDTFTSQTGARALAFPHHTTKRAYIQDWTYINPKYVKLAEVTSVHGEFLFEQRNPLNYRGAIDPPPQYTHGSSIADAYKMGYRMTLYAASDEHDGHPGHSLSHTRAYIGHQRPFSLWHTRNEHPYPGGISAVYADNLTREGIFSAIEHQRIFGCSDHGRPILDFTINNTRVGDGSTLIVDNQNSHRKLNIFLAQDGAPVGRKQTSASAYPNWVPNWNASIEIIKNGELWNTIDVSTPIINETMIDTEPITGTSFESNCIEIDGKWYINEYSDNPIDPTTLNTSGYDFYIIRVVCDNGRTAYIGPIWVEYDI